MRFSIVSSLFFRL